MKILVIGKSAREHVFIKSISKSTRAEKIYCIPGNPGISELAECVNIPINNISAMLEFAVENQIDLTVALDEYAIQSGITNAFKNAGLKIFAPTMEAAQIATSRAFAKKFLFKNKIPTPRYGLFDKENTAIDYASKSNYPLFVKYDHLADEDGFLCTSFNKAKNKINEVFEEVQKKVVLEEYIEGKNITLSILTDGYNVLPLPYVCEYKRVLDGDGGAFTKGVGAYTPSTLISEALENKIAQSIVFPLLDAMQENGISYEGFLSMQLLLLPNNEIKVIEFLPTLSIAEATCSLPLVEDDLLDVIYVATEGALEDCYRTLSISNDAVVSLCLMSGNYPNRPKLNSIVEGIENLDYETVELYYNETAMNTYYEVVTSGGRAFFITSRALTLNNAVQNLYENVDIVKYDGKNYRKDIGKTFVRKYCY